MFKVLNKVLKRVDITEEELKLIDKWQLMAWLSGNITGLQVAQTFNLYSNIPMSQKIFLLQAVLPKQITYIQYPSKSKSIDEYLNLISMHFKVNKLDAKLYYMNLSVSDLEELESMYNVGDVKETKSRKVKK